MYIDNHCHLFLEYFDNIDDYIKEASEAGVVKIIVNGCNMKTNKEVLELINKYNMVYGSLGFHPTEIDDFNESYFIWLEDNVKNKKIVAVGEIGLDYKYDIDKEKQKDIFIRQLNIAKNVGKPVIIHSRDALQDTYNILSSENLLNIGGVLHCYSGSLEMAGLFIKLGYYIGVGGIITFKNANNIIRVVENIGIDRILLETDAPYLTPEPYRIYKNSSKYIPVIAQRIADIKGITVNEVANNTTSNSMSLFDFLDKT